MLASMGALLLKWGLKSEIWACPPFKFQGCRHSAFFCPQSSPPFAQAANFALGRIWLACQKNQSPFKTGHLRPLALHWARSFAFLHTNCPFLPKCAIWGLKTRNMGMPPIQVSRLPAFCFFLPAKQPGFCAGCEFCAWALSACRICLLCCFVLKPCLLKIICIYVYAHMPAIAAIVCRKSFNGAKIYMCIHIYVYT